MSTTTYTYYPTTSRLSSIVSTGTVAGGLVNLTYGYDDVGNITSIGDAINPAPKDMLSDVFTPDTSRPHADGSTASGRSFHYDDNGNMDNNGSGVVAYTYENMPRSMPGGVSFLYDGNNTRTVKTSSNGRTVYYGKLLSCTNDAYCEKHIFAGNTRIAIKTGTQTFYHFSDHQGSTAAVIDSTGNKVEALTYYPFGETRTDDKSVYLDYKYTGQELDEETGLYNYNARLYDPSLGRFVTADTVVPDPANPQSLNRYSYTINNSLSYVDPSGHIWWLVGAIVGAISAGIQSDWDLRP